MCVLGYSFIILLCAKLSVLFTMPYVMYCLLNFYIGNNTSYCAGKSTPDQDTNTSLKNLTDFSKSILKHVKRLPIINKLLYIKFNSNHCLNPSIGKFKSNNPDLYSNSARYISMPKVKTVFYALPMFNTRPKSDIISAIISQEKPMSRFMFTYNSTVNYIHIEKVSIINCPYISTYILRVQEIGCLPKSGYFNKSDNSVAIRAKPSEITLISPNNYLFNTINNSKVSAGSSFLEKQVYVSAVNNKSEISSSFDIAGILPGGTKFNLDVKRDDYMNNINPELLNPFAFMMRLPNQNLGEDEINHRRSEISNKGKRKATEDEVNEWDDEQTSQDVVTISEEESDADNDEQSDTDNEMPEALKVYIQDMKSLYEAIIFVHHNGNTLFDDYVKRASCPTLNHIMSEYESFFISEDGDNNNTLEALNELLEYLTQEWRLESGNTTVEPAPCEPFGAVEPAPSEPSAPVEDDSGPSDPEKPLAR